MTILAVRPVLLVRCGFLLSLAAAALMAGCNVGTGAPTGTPTPTATATSTTVRIVTATRTSTTAATVRAVTATHTSATTPTSTTARNQTPTATRTASRTATRPSAAANRPPLAENLSTSTRPSAAVAITLKGSDADGDRLTYVVVRQPSKGNLTGAAPFLTYRAGPSISGTDSFTYKVSDGTTDSLIATVEITIEGLRWVRVGPAVVNVEKGLLAYHGGGSTPGYFTEPRFEGKFTVYRLTETSIAVDDRDVDRGTQFYNVTIRSGFDAPPAVLVPGAVHTLTVQFSHSGTVAQGSPGATFQYSADRNNSAAIQPREPLAYAPWSVGFAGVASKAWRLTVPNGQIGDTLQISAGWWNCGVCNVTWTYKPE